MNFGKTSTIKKDKDLNSKSKLIRNKFAILFLKVVFLCILALIIVGGCLGYGAYKGILASAPDINTIDPTPTGYSTTLYDDVGTNIGTLVSSGANRKYVTIDEIPKDMQHAFVAIEDSRFYEHNGIDLKGIIRAGFVGLTSGSLSEGASTITQQLLKNNVFTDWTSEETNLQKIRRKIQEQYLAIELEKKIQDKDWILENYMNSINLGQNTLGVQAASNRYFGKDVSELTLSEAAVIAGITKNPYGYNPISFPERNAKRREKVLTNMLDQGYINQSQYDAAMADDVYSRIQKVNTAIKEDHSASSYFQDELVEQVIDDLMKLKGYSESQAYKMVYSNGLSIYTTQNSQIQKV
ncbi:MAG: penicillin-binding protein, partial [Lachnospiraceae bacterium]|nr:penicillin-binding protein [Lachnospiraceae bacterium]